MSRLFIVIFTFLFSTIHTVAALAEDDQRYNGPLTPEELEQFVDLYWQENGALTNTPGLILTFVKDGKVYLNKGYGIENIETNTPVSPDLSVFRIASISKVFVGIAVAQLVEKGQLDLDANINVYLKDFQIEDEFVMPMTLRQLLTHQARLEDRFFMDSTRNKEDRESLREHLFKRFPPRIEKSNGISSYSNYGFAMAGFIVEEVTGVPFHQYVKEKILDPLGATHSGYLLENIDSGSLVKGYVPDDDELVEQPYTYVHRYPPTSMMVTGNDMAKFISANLNEGCLEEFCLFQNVGANLVYNQQFTHHPNLPGLTLAFMQWHYRSGGPGLWHDGSHAGFASELMLLPGQKSGFFIAVNNQRSGLASGLKRAILDKFYAKTVNGKNLPEFQIEDKEKYLGFYQQTRRSYKTLEKITVLFSPPEEIRMDEDGLLYFGILKYYPIAPNLFQSQSGDRFLAFRENEDGEITHFFVDWGGSPRALKRVPWDERIEFVASSLLVSLLAMFTGTILVHRKKRQASKFLKRAALAQVVLGMGFLIGFMGYLGTVNSIVLRMGEMTTLNIILGMPVLLVLATIGLGIALVKGWQQNNNIRVSGSLCIIGATGFLLFLNQWHLIGWNY